LSLWTCQFEGYEDWKEGREREMGRWNEELLGKISVHAAVFSGEMLTRRSGLIELVAFAASMAPRFLGWLRIFLVRCIGISRLLSMIKSMLRNSQPCGRFRVSLESVCSSADWEKVDNKSHVFISI
jgi:hypothetical protein